MNTEFLKGLGLSDDVAAIIMAEIETALNNEYERGLSEGNAQVEEIKAQQIIDAELTRFNAKNPEILKKLIDLSAVSFEDGKADGLTEQIELIRQENPFLFAPKIFLNRRTSMCFLLRLKTAKLLTEELLPNPKLKITAPIP